MADPWFLPKIEHTHNDCIQVVGGSNINLIGNNLSGGSNAALMITQGNSLVSNLKFNNNWVDGGWCSVNISRGTDKPNMTGLVMNNNRFGHNTTHLNCAIIRNPLHSDLVAIGNVYDDTNEPIVITRGA